MPELLWLVNCLYGTRIYGGVTNAGSIFGCFYPIFYLLYLIFWDSDTQMLSYTFLIAVNYIHLSIFGCGIYVLNNKILGNRVNSWICAVLATFCGCTLTGYQWSQTFIGIAWIPLFLYAYSNSLDKLSMARKKWIVVSAMILSMVGFGSTAHGLLFNAVCMFFCFISFVICTPNSFLFILKTSLVVGFLGLGLCAIQLLPFMQGMMLSYRYIDSASGVLDYAEYMRNVVPVSNLHQALGQHRGWYAMSLLLFLLTMLAFKHRLCRYKPMELFAKILFVFAICMVSGTFLPDLMWHIPGIKQIREQFLWVPYLSISCGILAGIGLSYLSNIIFSQSTYRFTVVDFIIVVLFAISLLPENNSNLFEWSIKLLPLMAIFIYVLLKIDLSLRKRIMCFILCTYTLLDYSLSIMAIQNNSSFMTIDEAQTKVEMVNGTLKKEFDILNIQKGDRVLSWGANNTYPSNSASVIGYYDCFAYMNPVYKKNWHLHSMEIPTRCLLQNIKYVFSSVKNEESFIKWLSACMGHEPEKQMDLYADYQADRKTPVYVHKIDTLGSAWLVDDFELYEDSDLYEDVFARLRQLNIEEKCLINSKYINRDLPQNETEHKNSIIELNSYMANQVSYISSADRDSILVTADIFYPGWKVYVDGKRQDILEVNYAFRGVYLEKGKHIIEFKFQPTLIFIGSFFGLCSICICMFLLVSRKRCEDNNSV